MTEPAPSPQLMHVSCPGFGTRVVGSDATWPPIPPAPGAPPQTHTMAYWQWGAADAGHVVVCVHGLTRQGRDFDVLAQALIARTGAGLRVVCPDVAGRGQSDWLADASGYQIPAYAADMVALLGQLHAQTPVTTLDWVGTSMGGLIGMVLAGQPNLPLPTPMRKLVLNDVGPEVSWAGLQRIQTYVGQTGRFDSLEAAADAMWAVSTSFGPHTRAQWLALSRPMVRPLPDGGFTLHYDPALALPVRAATEEGTQQGTQMLWGLYEQIKADTLVLRGSESDLLTQSTARAMTERGPRARVLNWEGVGHAPTLIADDQVQAIADFLFQTK